MSTKRKIIEEIDFSDGKSPEQRKRILNVLLGIQKRIVHSENNPHFRAFNQFQELRAEGKIT